MSGDGTPSLLEIADQVYGVALPDFTATRDRWVRELKGTERAAQVRALRKPSLAAWVLNLLVRRDPDQVAQILAVGESLRAAQASMSAEELRALTKQRRQLCAAVTRQARERAMDESVRLTSSVADQVESTLTAAMLDPDCARALRSGLLLTPMRATGVEAADVAAAVAVPDGLGFQATARPTARSAARPAERAAPGLRVVPDPDAEEKARAAARAALAEAEVEVDRAASQRDEAVEAVGTLEARTMQLQAETDELNRRLADLADSMDDADAELEQAEDARALAEQALTAAVRERDHARSRLES